VGLRVGGLTLQEGEVVYLDSCILIYMVEGYTPLQHALRQLWVGIKAEAIKATTSQLSILETLVLPKRMGDEDLLDRYEALYSSSRMTFVPISESILRRGAHLRAVHPSLRTPDAIHLATALGHGSHYFLTHDKRMTPVGDLRVVHLAELKLPD
jgi:predicted nucleic acid-binding protein